MRMRWVAWGALGWALVACAPVAVNPPPSLGELSPSPATSAEPSLLPSAAPSVAGAASPSPAPSASPGFLAEGALFRRYDWLGLGRPFYDRGTNRLYVADAVARTSTDQRYQLLRFDGTTGDFLGVQSATPTEPKGLEAPARIEAVAFDRRGIPLMAHVDKDHRFRLLEAFSATIRVVGNYQVTEVERIGPVSMASDGLVLTQVLLRRDPDKNVSGNRRWLMTQAEPGEQPQALVNMDEPLPQTLFMAASPKGGAFVAALRANGSPALARLQGSTPNFQDLGTLRRAPDGLFVDQDGRALTVENKTSEAAVLDRLGDQGQVLSSTRLVVQGGGFVNEVIGLCPDGRGGLFVTGRGLDAANRSVVGLYRFPLATP